MQLQERVVRSNRSPALDSALQGDLGQSGGKPRDVDRPVGRSLKFGNRMSIAQPPHDSTPSIPLHLYRLRRALITYLTSLLGDRALTQPFESTAVFAVAAVPGADPHEAGFVHVDK